MNELFKDKEHLVRLILITTVGILVFFILRIMMVPKGFGEYGHYRGPAIGENRNHPLAYAGMAACAECHENIVQIRKGSHHARISCETCHGALAKHASDPSLLTPEKPEGRALCLTCHRINVARPAKFPQVDPRDHGDGEGCTECHNPHHPEMSDETKEEVAP